jgi:acetyl-CoA C-acetyltransferase
MPEAVIVATARSPIGRAKKGSLAGLRPDDLAAQTLQAALGKVPELSHDDIEDVIVGCAQPAGEQGYNVGRMVALRAGMVTAPGTTVHRYCASSLQAARMAFHAVRAGEGDVFVAAGVECVSRYGVGKSDGLPDSKNAYYAEAMRRTENRNRDGGRWRDPGATGELPDVYIAMGDTAENVAQACDISRSAQDEFAVRSQQLAEYALDRGFWAADIAPVTLPDGSVVDTDDCPRRGVTMESVSAMKPAFRPDGTVTAANCCPLNDGAAALVITSDVRAAQLGIAPLARIVSTGVSALNPEIMGLGPVEACRRAMKNAGLGLDQIDLIEINEAFAAQVLPCISQLDLDIERVNVNGGAIALGHPFGSTGARMVTSLLHALQDRDQRYGMATMCAAGGQGMALVIERLG